MDGIENAFSWRHCIQRCSICTFSWTTVIIRDRRVGFVEKISIDDSIVQQLWTPIIFEIDVLSETFQFTFNKHDRLPEECPNNAFRARGCGQRTFVSPEILQILSHQPREIELKHGGIIFPLQRLCLIKKSFPFVAGFFLQKKNRTVVGLVIYHDTLHEDP